MKEQIQKLIDAAVADYAKWKNACWKARGAEYNEGRIAKFTEDWSTTQGKKYIKVVHEGSAWCFIVKEDDGKFKAGDILKAASWSAPAKNKARGNIFGDFSVAWTGPHYLR